MFDKHTHADGSRTTASGALSRRGFLCRAASLGGAATATAGPFGAALADAPDGDGKLFLIGLEEHFATPELRRRQTGKDERLFAGGGRRPELLDLGAGRIRPFAVRRPGGLRRVLRDTNLSSSMHGN